MYAKTTSGQRKVLLPDPQPLSTARTPEPLGHTVLNPVEPTQGVECVLENSLSAKSCAKLPRPLDLVQFFFRAPKLSRRGMCQ